MRRSLAIAALLLAGASARADEGSPPETSAPSYYEHVAPILQRRCQVCHRPGAIGPFSLLTYEDAAGNSAMIEEVVENRRMPPWHANPEVGPHFSNDRTLPAAERRTLLDWIAAGVPAGDPAAAPPPARFPDASAWRIGVPDAVVQIPREVTVPATGVVDYQYFEVPTDFGEDKWVRAMEIKVTAPSVVHHVLVFVVYPDRRASPRVQGGLQGYFASMLPGESVEPFPEGSGKWLPRGATLRFQIHYTPDGEERRDRPSLALKFAGKDERITRRVQTKALFEVRFAIPPGAKDHVVRAQYDFRQDALLTGLLPHMHLRGKSFRYLLRYPDGTSRALLDIPRYDFNWQNTYRLAEPLYVPKGSRMIGVASYDNSADNPANPDPARVVRFGEQTWDEMMIGYMDLLDPTDADRAAWERAQEGGSGK